MTAALFDLADLRPQAADPERCGRDRKDGGACRAWPMTFGPACAHHILSDELAVVEALRRPSAAA